MPLVGELRFLGFLLSSVWNSYEGQLFSPSSPRPLLLSHSSTAGASVRVVVAIEDLLVG
jgi:hypothetical protein